VLLLIEPLLAWRFVPGVIALGVVTVLALSIPTLGWQVVIVLALSVAGAVTFWSRRRVLNGSG
jgi:hypothetical protein